MAAERAREALQWFGLLGGALAWVGQFVVGQGVTHAVCNVGGRGFGIDTRVWELTLTASAGAVALLAEAAAAWLFLELRRSGSEPPAGRQVFFAYASIAGNVLFLAVILLSGIASVYHLPCNQA